MDSCGEPAMVITCASLIPRFRVSPSRKSLSRNHKTLTGTTLARTGISSLVELHGKRTLTALFGRTFAPAKSGKCKPNPAMRTRHEEELIPKETAGTVGEAGETQKSKGKHIRAAKGRETPPLSHST